MSIKREKLKSKILEIVCIIDSIQVSQIEPLEAELETNLRKLYPNCPDIENWSMDVAYNGDDVLERMDLLYGRQTEVDCGQRRQVKSNNRMNS